MRIKFRGFFFAFLGLVAALASPSANANEHSKRLASRWMQDEVDELPADNTAFFGAVKQVRIQLDLLGEAAEFAANEALVTVVKPSGQSRQYTPDAAGLVTIDDAEAGPHAVVASSRKAHGTTLFLFQPAMDDPFADDLGKGLEPEPMASARMTMLSIDYKDLVPIVSQAAQASTSSPDSLSDDVKRGGTFGYRVSLSDDGVLRGQVMSVMQRSPDVSLAGTRVAIFFDGAEVGGTTCDASGVWKIFGVLPGIHGLVASGPAGYTAFAFEAFPSTDDGIVAIDRTKQTLVRAVAAVAERLPVVLVPPPMVPAVATAITTYYPPVAPAMAGAGAGAAMAEAIAMGAPVAALAASPSGNSGGGGGTAGGAAGGGLGGLAGLASVGAIAAAVAVAADDEDSPGIIASPSFP